MWDSASARLFAALSAAVVLATVVSAQLERKIQPRPILILGGTLIDGSGEPAAHNGAILITDGHIKAAGLNASRRAPKDARQIDATGKWILPGLIDADVHLFETSGLDARPDRLSIPGARPYRQVLDDIRRNPAPYLRAYVCAGVTSIVDLGGPSWLFDVRDSRRDDALSPRIASAGPMLATAVPTALQVDGEPFWAMKSETDVKADVGRLADRRADLVSIEWTPGRDRDADWRVVSAGIAAAHAAKLRVAVHASTLDTARLAVEGGADVLVGGVTDRPVDDDLLRALVRRKVIYVPALIAANDDRAVASRQVEFEPFERGCTPAPVLETFAGLKDLPETAIPAAFRDAPDPLPVMKANLKRVVDAGGTVAAGSGAGSIRTLHGSSLHRELALMVEAGLSPMQALVAATSGGALSMGRQDVGKVAAGMLGDLVVLEDDPLADIRNTRRISVVIRGGAIYER